MDALLRRAGTASWAEEIYDDAVIRLDPQTRTVRTLDVERRLTGTELRLLNVLVRNAGLTLTPSQLLTHAWDDPSGVGTERVKFVVPRLRRKLGCPTRRPARSSRSAASATGTGPPPP